MTLTTPPFILAQISDLHLTGEVGIDPSYDKFLQVLTQALTHSPNAIVLTGDLVNDGHLAGYDWLFLTLQKTGVPFFCVAGNHDVTHELNAHLPFSERTLLPAIADSRLADCVAVALGDWRLVLLDSTIGGRVGGRLDTAQLDWLSNYLKSNKNNTIIALHHPPVAVGSKWIDEHRLANGDAFVAVVNQFSHAKAVICGHIHQVQTLTLGTATLLSCPAVARQFLPFADEFALDDLPSGFRLLTLGDGLDSRVVRLEN